MIVPEAEEEPETVLEAEPEPAEALSAEPSSEPQPEPEEAEKLSAFAWWMIPVALGVFLVGSGVVLLIVLSCHHGKHEKRWRDRVEK